MRLHKYNFRKPNFKLLAAAFIFVFSNFSSVYSAADSYAITTAEKAEYMNCTDIKVVFARGSGVAVGSNRDYVPFSTAMLNTFGSRASVSFYELGSKPGGWHGHSYPAPGIGVQTWQRFTTSLGALVSGGETYTYGDSVETGADEAFFFIYNYSSICPNSKIVLAGYSQGAQVVSRTLQKIDPSWIYAALTFGDPKLYLPEGKFELLRMSPLACRDHNSFSPYRAYVPDCYTYEGILGGYVPYMQNGYSGKLEAYCQWHDVICSSYIDIDDLAYGHASYDEQGTYERAAKDVYNMYFGVSEPTSLARDLVLIIDNTTSSSDLLRKFKTETLKLASRTFSAGGKVKVYYYFVDKTDMSIRLDSLCERNCRTVNQIKTELQYVSSTYKAPTMSPLDDIASVLRETEWQSGANKSLVFLTDTRLENPTNTNVSRKDVIDLAYSLDPVNLYAITTQENREGYDELAEKSGGSVYVLSADEISEKSDEPTSDLDEKILAHEPSVVTESLTAPILATTSNLYLAQTGESSANLSFMTTAAKNILILNDMILGFLDGTSIEISDLDLEKNNEFCLAPLSSAGFRGEKVCKILPAGTFKSSGRGEVPKAPNTGLPAKKIL